MDPCKCREHDYHEYCRAAAKALTDRFGNKLVTLEKCECYEDE